MTFVEELVHLLGSRHSFWGLNSFWTECHTSPLLKVPWSPRPIQAPAFDLPSWPPLSSSFVQFFSALPPMKISIDVSYRTTWSFLFLNLASLCSRSQQKRSFLPILHVVFLKKIKDLFGFVLLFSALSHVLVEVGDTRAPDDQQEIRLSLV